MPVSEKQKEYAKKHITEKLDQITIRPHREIGQQIRTAAAAAGESVNQYVLKAVRDRMEKEKAGE